MHHLKQGYRLHFLSEDHKGNGPGYWGSLEESPAEPVINYAQGLAVLNLLTKPHEK